jgi:hypothetical protein
MGRFSGLSQVQVFGGGQYFEPGLYKVEVEAVKLRESHKDGSELFIIEAKILESSREDRPAGSTCSQIIKIGNGVQRQTALRDVKQFLAACLDIEDPNSYVPEDGESPDQFWENAAELAVSNDQPLKGSTLSLEAYHIQTKAGHPFTKHAWSV